MRAIGCSDTTWQYEIGAVAPDFSLEGQKHVEYGLHERHRHLETPHLQRDRKLKQVALRKLASAAAPLRLPDLWDDDRLFAEMNQSVLRDPERLCRLGEGEGPHERHFVTDRGPFEQPSRLAADLRFARWKLVVVFVVVAAPGDEPIATEHLIRLDQELPLST